MANAHPQPDSNGCQFFVTLDSAPHLNGTATIFGKYVFSHASISMGRVERGCRGWAKGRSGAGTRRLRFSTLVQLRGRLSLLPTCFLAERRLTPFPPPRLGRPPWYALFSISLLHRHGCHPLYLTRPPHLPDWPPHHRVIHGNETLVAMEAVPVDADDRPQTPILLERVTIHANPLADQPSAAALLGQG